MLFKVAQRFGNRQIDLPQQFNQLQDAEAFIMGKLQEDRVNHVQATYGIYEGADLVCEFTERDLKSTGAPPSSAGAPDTRAGGRGQGAAFNPSPLNTTPRPPGMPQNWRNPPPDKEDDKKT